MPYIAINTSLKLDEERKAALKTALGENITLISGKTEQKLMVDISDGHAMYFKGDARELAFIDVRCFGRAELSDKKTFTQAVFQSVQKITGLPQDGIYLCYGEYENWGTMGSLK